MESLTIKNKQSGFGLIQVVIAASLMSVLSLGVAGLITSQAQQISYMEDRMSHQSLKAEFEIMLGKNDVCTNTILNVQVPKNSSGKENIVIRNKDGDIIYDPNDNSKNTYDKLKVENAYIRNIDIDPSVSLTGDVEIVIEPVRLRKGGGPEVMKPIVIKKTLAVDAGGVATGCELELASEELACVHQDFRSFRNSTFKTNARKISTVYGYATTAYPEGSFKVPEDVVAFEIGGLTIYPGQTKLGGRLLRKGKYFESKIVGSFKWEHTAGSGNQWWKSAPSTRLLYDGVVLQANTGYQRKRCGGDCTNPANIIHPMLNQLVFDSLPGPCARLNTKIRTRNLPENLGVKLYNKNPTK